MTLFGYGKTTKALARKVGSAKFYDDNVNKPFTDEEGFKVYPSHMFEAKYSHIEIPSPGLPPHHPLIQKANNLVSEYDYFASVMPYTVWISGTNGKTTTTQMMTHLLEDKGAISGGNIGTPLADLDQKAPIWILETSSFTLHYTKVASPGIYILLPITPDHISWHGSMQAYEDAKLQPLKTMQEGEIAIIPKKYAHTPTRATIVAYDTLEDIANYFGIETAKLNYKGAFLMDALLAMAVDKILFDRYSYDKINAFVIDPHRQEKIQDNKGRVWINDSKATNIDATIELLKTYSDDQSIHIILGGDDKGVELSSLFEHLSHYKRMELYLIGKNSQRLAEYATHYRIPFLACGTLHEAITQIDALHTSKSVAMLSPAAASLDQFSSYVERGEQFKESVSKLS